MTRLLARAALMSALLSVTACRSAFAPEPVMKVTAQAATVPATTTRDTVIRTGPDASAHVVEAVPAGTALTSADQSSRGFRRVKTADGKSGFVEESALTFGAAPATAAPAAPAPAAEAAPSGAPQ